MNEVADVAQRGSRSSGPEHLGQFVDRHGASAVDEQVLEDLSCALL